VAEKAAVQNPSARTGVARALLQQFGTAEFGSEARDSIHRTAVYVIRSLGVVAGRGREVLSYPDWAARMTIDPIRFHEDRHDT
jgi:hypothetical protein